MANLPETGVKLVAEGLNNFLGNLNKATDGVFRFEGSTRGASVGTIALGTAIGDLVATGLKQIGNLMVQAGNATVGFLTDSVSMAAGLEAQMSGVAAVLGVSNDDLEKLNDLVIDLGINPRLKVSSLEAAQAIEILAKNGLNMTQIMEGAAEQSIFLANATGADFGTAADIATDVMAIFGYEADEMATAVNGISAVVQSSKFDINDYALALANGGSVASSVGVSFEDFNTAIAAISPSFSSGMTAGTAMKNLLLRLAPSTKKAEEEMIALGIITEDGANQFFDAEGNMRDLSEISGILANSLGGLSEQQKVSTLRTIFGNDAMAAAIALSEVGQEEFEALGASMAQVDAGAAAATRVDNFAGAMDILGGTIEAVKLQIGDAFLPILTRLAQKFSELVEVHGAKFVNFFSGAATFIGSFFDALMTGEGFIDSFLGALESIGVGSDVLLSIRSKIDNAFGWFTENKDYITGAITAIGGALLGLLAVSKTLALIGGLIALVTNPLFLLVAGIGALVAIWSGNAGNIQGIAEQLKVIAGVRFKQVSDSATVLAQEAMPILAENVTKASWIMRYFLGGALKTASENAAGLFGSFMALVTTALPILSESVTKASWILRFYIGGALKTASENAAGLFKSFMALVTTALPILSESITKSSWILRFYIVRALKKASEWATSLWEAIKENLVSAFDALKQIAHDLKPYLQGIVDVFEGIVDVVSRAVVVMLQFVGIKFPRAAGTVTKQRAYPPQPVRPAGEQRPIEAPQSALPEDLSNPNIDPLLVPGSPTPLELGLMGIASAMENIISLGPSFSNAITPPANGQQIAATSNNINNSQTVTLNNNFSSQPEITDRNVLITTLAGL